MLPGLFDSGYCVEDKDFAYALALEKELPSSLKELAKNTKPTLLLIAKKRAYALWYSLYRKEGFVGKYRKIYLFRDEKKRFARGQDCPVFELVFKDLVSNLACKFAMK